MDWDDGRDCGGDGGVWVVDTAEGGVAALFALFPLAPRFFAALRKKLIQQAVEATTIF